MINIEDELKYVQAVADRFYKHDSDKVVHDLQKMTLAITAVNQKCMRAKMNDKNIEEIVNIMVNSYKETHKTNL